MQERRKMRIDGKRYSLFMILSVSPEITAELASENGLTVDFAGFKELYRHHQELSRQGRNGSLRADWLITRKKP